MRHTMDSAPGLTANEQSSAALASAALATARDAIARWSGKPLPACGALARDAVRVSPQARWLAETERGLAAFIAHGGFSRDEDGAPRKAPGQGVQLVN